MTDALVPFFHKLFASDKDSTKIPPELMRYQQIIEESLYWDRMLQNHVLVTPESLSPGMWIALHALWKGRSKADIERIKKP